MNDKLKSSFCSCFGAEPEYIFQAPGRTELGGNHTDHQNGRVLAAAVELFTRAAVRKTDAGVIRVLSEGYPPCVIDLGELTPRPGERGTTAALIRGTAAGAARLGFSVGGFDACVVSDVLPGSGLSSSAAFEVLIAAVIDRLYCSNQLTKVELAKLGQLAENEFFGKPCGLMDQTACAVGGVAAIDFACPQSPAVEKIDFDLGRYGYALCIIDTGSSHSDLGSEYAGITEEMGAVAALFGKRVLGEVKEESFYAHLNRVRQEAGDRAAMRAIHFFNENRLVADEVKALKTGDMDGFLSCVSRSGRSSWMYLQNVIPAGQCKNQEMAVALAMAERLLGGRGAFRVHGGGFGGTILAFVPLDMLEDFRPGMDGALGSGSCRALSFSSLGAEMMEDMTND